MSFTFDENNFCCLRTCLCTCVTINWILGSYKINFSQKKIVNHISSLICGFLVRTFVKVPTQNDGVGMAELEAPHTTMFILI